MAHSFCCNNRRNHCMVQGTLIMTWAYQQSTGNDYDPAGALIATGYSGGNCGMNKEGVNNPSLQAAHCVGPLPIGIYTFGTPINHPKLGPFAIPLIPDPANTMFGRAVFYIHGDTSACNQSASEGCIILPRAIREAMWNSPDHQLTVTA